MSAFRPQFWSNPIRFMRWASHEKPALFFSVCLGASGPPLVFIVPPIRRYLGDVDPEKIPMTYPVPKGPRKIPEGYDD
ncbi:hypothetical protein MMC10_007153 [Thelotrema lepadinum]|nr:hypothetical protein [Thelotrema lepadinum]